MSALQHESVPSAIGKRWILLERLENAKQDAIAEHCGIDAGTLSKFKSGFGCIKLAHFKLMLQALGLKLVSADAVCVPRADHEALQRIAARALATHPGLLFQDDPE